MENIDTDKLFIRDNFQPVFLGNTRAARKLASKLYRKHQIVSYILDTRRPLFSELTLAHTFIRVSGAAHGALLVDELSYVFSLDTSCVFATLPFTKEYADFLERYKPMLEKLCVFRTQDDIFSKFPFINNENGGHDNDASFSY